MTIKENHVDSRKLHVGDISVIRIIGSGHHDVWSSHLRTDNPSTMYIVIILVVGIDIRTSHNQGWN